MDVGTRLRIARRRRELSLAEVAAATKIPVVLLQAIDNNEFEKVPPGIFVRGFIRAYAREVGLDPRQVIDQYLAESAATQPAHGRLDRGHDEIDDTPFNPDLTGSRPDWGYALIVAALVVGLISFNRSGAPADGAAAQPPTADAPATITALDTLETTAAALTPVATSGAGLRFEIQVQGPCWVRAVVDGRTVVARLMQSGEREAIDAQHDVVLRVGDPGAFSYSINGRPGTPLGANGIPVTVRFTSDGQRNQRSS